MTKITTRINISNENKTEMIANGIKIPSQDICFEMSPKYAALMAARGIDKSNLIVHSDESIYVEYIRTSLLTPPAVLRGKIDDRDCSINDRYNFCVGTELTLSNILITDIKTGVLLSGMNIDTYLENLDIQRKENLALIQKIADEVADFPNHASQRAAAQAAYEEAENKKMNESIEASKKEREIKEAADKKLLDERKVVHQKRVAWAAEHGSERLKKGLDQGYRCIKLYEREFGEHVLGSGYIWDREDVVTEKDHACPSLETLNICEEFTKDDRVMADIKWLPKGLDELNDNDERQYEEQSSGCEAVSVKVIEISGTWYRVM